MKYLKILNCHLCSYFSVYAMEITIIVVSAIVILVVAIVIVVARKKRMCCFAGKLS